MDHLEAAKRAQERVDALRAAGAEMRSDAVRQAVNQLMTRLRSLTPEQKAAFDRWRAAASDE
jgi:hypothetical protein